MKRLTLSLILSLACLAAGPATQPTTAPAKAPATWAGDFKDRRPIGGLWLSELLTTWQQQNPKGNAGQFQAWLKIQAIAWADNAVAMNAQGVCLWDNFEHGRPGNKYSSLSYVGDIGCTDPMMPRAALVELAKPFHARGLKCMSCVRPGEIVQTADGRCVRVAPYDYGFNLLDKMLRARAIGWGDGFYVDSPQGIDRGLLKIGPLVTIREWQEPDNAGTFHRVFNYDTTMIVMEQFSDPDYFGQFGGYFDPNVSGPPPVTPPGGAKGFFWIHPIGGDWKEENRPAYVASRHVGNVLVFRAMYPGDPYNAIVKSIEQQATAP